MISLVCCDCCGVTEPGKDTPKGWVRALRAPVVMDLCPDCTTHPVSNEAHR